MKTKHLGYILLTILAAIGLTSVVMMYNGEKPAKVEPIEKKKKK